MLGQGEVLFVFSPSFSRPPACAPQVVYSVGNKSDVYVQYAERQVLRHTHEKTARRPAAVTMHVCAHRGLALSRRASRVQLPIFNASGALYPSIYLPSQPSTHYYPWMNSSYYKAFVSTIILGSRILGHADLFAFDPDMTRCPSTHCVLQLGGEGIQTLF